MVQGCIRIFFQQPSRRLYWVETRHPWLKNNMTKSGKGTPRWKSKSKSFHTSSLIKGQSLPSALVRYSLRFSHPFLSYDNKTGFIYSILRKTEVPPYRKIKTKQQQQQNKQNKTTTQKMKFSIMAFFRKCCDQIHTVYCGYLGKK